MTLGHEVRTLDSMTSFGLWLRRITPGCELRKNLGLWITWATLDHDLRALNAMNNVGIWLT